MTSRTMTLTAAILTSAFLAAAGTAYGAQPKAGANPDGECESRKGEQTALKTDDVQPGAKSGTMNTADKPNEGQAAGTDGDAKSKNKEIVENTKTAEDGSKVVQGGPAGPTENWFGCNPEKTKEDKENKAS